MDLKSRTLILEAQEGYFNIEFNYYVLFQLNTYIAPASHHRGILRPLHYIRSR